MIKKLIITTAVIAAVSFSANAQGDMNGEEPEKKKLTKKELSPNKHKYTEVQKKYQNQIVFSKSEIKKDKEDPATFVNTWQMGEPLYFRIYNDQTLIESVYDYDTKKGTEFNEYLYGSFSEQTVVSINGKEMASYHSVSGDKDKVTNWVTKSGHIYDLTQEKKTVGFLTFAINEAFQAMRDDFKEGTYEVDIKIYALPSASHDSGKEDRHALMSSGKLKIIVTKEGMNKFAPFLCRDILKRNGQMIDPAVEDQIMQMYAKEYGVKMLSANISDSDWTIERNQYGVVLFRYVSASIVYIHTDGQTYLGTLKVKQDHDGSKFQTSVKTFMHGNNSPYCAFCADYRKTIK